jgi:clan AA aspartic protease
MNGFIDENGRALLSVDVRPNPTSDVVAIEVWVDTGFTGDLVLPQNAIDSLGLDRSGSVDAILADGSQIELDTYTCFVNWFGEERRLEVVANEGDYPLLGVGLLLGLELRVNYHTLELTLDVP